MRTIRAALVAVRRAALVSQASAAQVIEQDKHHVFLTTIVKMEYFDSTQYSLEGD